MTNGAHTDAGADGHHSVARHLEVDPSAYDAAIRRFVPAYDAMLDEVVGALREHLGDRAAHVLDLGAGTGGLSARIAEAFSKVKLTLLDADAEMLAKASDRLASHAGRVTALHATFAEPFPPADAVVASLSLHHVHSLEEKTAVYRRIAATLSPGGIFVSADAFVPSDERLRTLVMDRWATHLVAAGDTDAEARARFAQWSIEDRYLSIEEELSLLRAAGFGAIDVRFRYGPEGVIVATPVR